MTQQLLVLGLNMLIIAGLLAAYGLATGYNNLVGVAASLGVLGGVFIAYSRIPRDPAVSSLLNYSKILVEGVTSTIEDLDLLDASLCIVTKGSEVLAVYSKIPCPSRVDPGLGFAGGSPYLAIPLDMPVLELVESSTGELDTIEKALRTIVIEELGMARDVGVSATGNIYRVYVSGLADALKEYVKYPVDPYSIIIASTLARAAMINYLRVIEKTQTLDGVLITLGVGEVAG
ncbi:hypothetical protein IMZ38_03000 [Thermosphaera chiliense]|uniref:Uncharacterized protein n=1 Tax=Thermosphaera chiliense TaxID=3402707 RepID=A0A7M1US79_9CREN|nr:hypothetical protein [Thermosphaera aggregans]QOR94896.1 hypothetical protein IMZ38_03000 [Thermosphaera aggregans]